jgi:gamma-glutamylcyclotransferase (GGCT)/AIG2-like uncharacterized protein YtfP
VLLIKVFVYGSLKRGYPNHHILEEQKFLGNARTEKGYTLYEYGCPVLVTEGDDYVDGELYECDEQTIYYLDRLECHPTLYTRLPVIIIGYADVQAYLWNHTLSNIAVHCGRNWENPLWKNLCQ